MTAILTSAITWLAGKMPLWAWSVLAAIALLIAAYLAGDHHGATVTQAKWDIARAAATLAASKQETAQAEATTEVLTQYADRVKVVYQRGADIIKEVPTYVTPDTCALPGGFRLLHDAAANGEIPNPAGITNAPAVPAQDLAATVAGNYAEYHAVAEQLKALQEWVRRQQGLGK